MKENLKGTSSNYSLSPWGTEQGPQCCFADDTNWGKIKSATEANHAVEAKKCTKKWDTRAKLLFYMLLKPTDIIYLPFPGLMVPNRDFNMPWHRWQWEHQKTIGFISKTLLFCTCMMLVCTFLCTFLHDYDVKMPNFMLYGVRKQATTKFYFSFWTRMDMVLRKSTPGGFNYIWQRKWAGIIAIKTERT